MVVGDVYVSAHNYMTELYEISDASLSQEKISTEKTRTLRRSR